MTTRNDRLAPGGIPRWIRCYDNGGASLDRYTVVYTRLGFHYPYVGMNAHPFHPQGICMHGEVNHGPIDRPTYGHLGKRIKFTDLPPDCQQAVRYDYCDYWQLDSKST